MRYISTRSQSTPQSFAQCVAQGLAPDGGLYLPESLPDFSGNLKDWESLSYPDLCREFLWPFVEGDFTKDQLDAMVKRAYVRFTAQEIAPLKQLDDATHVLELFHGPTLAFKDFALQLLGEFYEAQITRTGHAINILGATSGDTGSAAIHGMLGKKGAAIFILYPYGRVSPLQERQMTCTGASNVFPIAIDGTFDDAQDIVKELFGDRAFKQDCSLSAVNSINIARILAQCVYYFWAWLRLPKAAREKGVHFVVPTGNFGNILAGWLARKMGLPIATLRVATNQNDILHRLFTTGVYQVGEVKPSLAPSMDIQVASNFERFLYFAEGCAPEKVRAVMETFKRAGKYVFENFAADGFSASRMDDARIPDVIRAVYEKYRYILDPHTACAFAEPFAEGTTVVLATASPAKFPETIEQAIGVHPTDPSLEALKQKPMQRARMEASSARVADYIKRHCVR